MIMQEIKIKGVDEVILHEKCDNGLDIYMWVNERVNNYYMTFNVKYGSVNTEFKLKKDKKVYSVPKGVAHFLEHIKFNLPDGKTANDFYNQYGISINAFTTFDFTAYEVFGNNNFKEALDYLVEYVNTPYFTEEMVEKEKSVICEEIKMSKSSPSSKLFFGSYRAVFHNDPHRYIVTGEEEDVKKIKLKDINLVYDNFYHPSNSFIVITGNFNPYEAVAIIKERYSKLKIGKYSEPKVIKPTEPYSVAKKYDVIKTNVEIPKAKILYKIKRSNFKDFDDVLLRIYLGIVLRSNFGATSDFKEDLIEKELVTALGYSRDIFDDYVVISIVVESKYMDTVLDMIKEKMMHLEVDEDSLVRRKRANIASLIYDYDDIEYINTDIQDNIMEYGYVVDNFYEIYNSLDMDMINKIIKEISIDNYSVVEIVPNKKDEER